MSRVGQGQFMFAPVPGWEQLPAGWKFVEAVGVATDSRIACSSSIGANIR